jgi:hypothetical protein
MQKLGHLFVLKKRCLDLALKDRSLLMPRQ